MAGASNGKALTILSHARITRQTVFRPPYRTAAGKDISESLLFSVAVNDRMSKDTDYFDCIAWGKRARTLAHFLIPGKEITLFCRPTSALIVTKLRNGAIVMDTNAAGQQVEHKHNRVNMSIDSWVFGSESLEGERKLGLIAQQEVQAGLRPVNWNNTQHPDNAMWKQIMKQRVATPYMGGDSYGMAKVIKANGTILTYDANGNKVVLGGQPQAPVYQAPPVAPVQPVHQAPQPTQTTGQQLAAIFAKPPVQQSQVPAYQTPPIPGQGMTAGQAIVA